MPCSYAYFIAKWIFLGWIRNVWAKYHSLVAGVRREVARDAMFMGEVKRKEKDRASNARDKTQKKAIAFLQQQESDFKSGGQGGMNPHKAKKRKEKWFSGAWRCEHPELHSVFYVLPYLKLRLSLVLIMCTCFFSVQLIWWNVLDFVSCFPAYPWILSSQVQCLCTLACSPFHTYTVVRSALRSCPCFLPSYLLVSIFRSDVKTFWIKTHATAVKLFGRTGPLHFLSALNSSRY